MNYLNEKQEICENDIILTHKYKGAKEHLAIINSIDEKNQLVSCTLIESAEVVYAKLYKISFVQHTTPAEAKRYLELVTKLARNRYEKYTNLEYIKDNIEFKGIINKTSVEFLAERARIDRKDIQYWEHLHDGIALATVYSNPVMYKCVLIWGYDYDDAEIDDLMKLHILFN